LILSGNQKLARHPLFQLKFCQVTLSHNLRCKDYLDHISLNSAPSNPLKIYEVFIDILSITIPRPSGWTRYPIVGWEYGLKKTYQGIRVQYAWCYLKNMLFVTLGYLKKMYKNTLGKWVLADNSALHFELKYLSW